MALGEAFTASSNEDDEWTFKYGDAELTSVDDLEQLFYQLKSTVSAQEQLQLVAPNMDLALLQNALIRLYTNGGKLNGQEIKKNRLKVDKYKGILHHSNARDIADSAGMFTSFRLWCLRLFRLIGSFFQFILGKATHIFAFVFSPIWSLVLTIGGLSYLFDMVCAIKEALHLSRHYEVSFWQVLREDNYKLLMLFVNGIVWESVNLVSVIIFGIPMNIEWRDTINHDENTIGFGLDVPNDSVSLFAQWRKQERLNQTLSSAFNNGWYRCSPKLAAVRAEGIKNSDNLYSSLIKKLLVSTLILVGMIVLYHAVPIAAGIAAHHFLLANTMWTTDAAIKFYGSSIAFFIGSCYAGFIPKLRKTNRYKCFSNWLGKAFNKLWSSESVPPPAIVQDLEQEQKQVKQQQEGYKQEETELNYYKVPQVMPAKNSEDINKNKENKYESGEVTSSTFILGSTIGNTKSELTLFIEKQIRKAADLKNVYENKSKNNQCLTQLSKNISNDSEDKAASILQPPMLQQDEKTYKVSSDTVVLLKTINSRPRSASAPVLSLSVPNDSENDSDILKIVPVPDNNGLGKQPLQRIHTAKTDLNSIQPNNTEEGETNILSPLPNTPRMFTMDNENAFNDANNRVQIERSATAKIDDEDRCTPPPLPQRRLPPTRSEPKRKTPKKPLSTNPLSAKRLYFDGSEFFKRKRASSLDSFIPTNFTDIDPNTAKTGSADFLPIQKMQSCFSGRASS